MHPCPHILISIYSRCSEQHYVCGINQALSGCPIRLLLKSKILVFSKSLSFHRKFSITANVMRKLYQELFWFYGRLQLLSIIQNKVGFLDINTEGELDQEVDILVRREAGKYFGEIIKANIAYKDKSDLDNKKSSIFLLVWKTNNVSCRVNY